MAKTFSNIVDNVANDIQDTTSEMKSIIGRYVNNRLRKVLRATNFRVINDDYTVTTLPGTASYTLPADFGKELYCIDLTNGVKLEKITVHQLGTDSYNDIGESGAVCNYSIFRDDSNNIIMKLYRIPTGTISIGLPYTVKIRTDMSDDDIPINDFADLLEIGATADAWRYKRQFAKAGQLEIIFDSELDAYMWDSENQENGVNKFTVSSDEYDRSYIG
jgi:hypothetical protein